MTADREKLREGLVDQIARVIDLDAHHLGRPDYYGPELILAAPSARVRVARRKADAIIEGSLAPILAQADSAERMEAERDEARRQLLIAVADRDEQRRGRLDAETDAETTDRWRGRALAADKRAANADRLSAEVEALKARLADTIEERGRKALGDPRIGVSLSTGVTIQSAGKTGETDA